MKKKEKKPFAHYFPVTSWETTISAGGKTYNRFHEAVAQATKKAHIKSILKTQCV